MDEKLLEVADKIENDLRQIESDLSRLNDILDVILIKITSD